MLFKLKTTGPLQRARHPAVERFLAINQETETTFLSLFPIVISNYRTRGWYNISDVKFQNFCIYNCWSHYFASVTHSVNGNLVCPGRDNHRWVNTCARAVKVEQLLSDRWSTIGSKKKLTYSADKTKLLSFWKFLVIPSTLFLMWVFFFISSNQFRLL